MTKTEAIQALNDVGINEAAAGLADHGTALAFYATTRDGVADVLCSCVFMQDRDTVRHWQAVVEGAEVFPTLDALLGAL